MQTKSLARISAVAFVAVAITATAIQLRDRPKMDPDQPVIATSRAEPLRDKLAQCQAIGLAASSDDLCLRAWKENRRRFLALPAGADGLSADVDQPDAANAAAAPPAPIATTPVAGEEH